MVFLCISLSWLFNDAVSSLLSYHYNIVAYNFITAANNDMFNETLDVK
jgi:hypothetical protein